MDLKLIRNLVRIMERGEVGELEIEDEKAGLRILLRRGRETQGHPGGPVVNLMGGTAAPAAQPSGVRSDPDIDEPDVLRADVDEFTSPMVGTFYRSSSPDADPFVGIGDAIQDESVICIIEAMKVMNEIKAECAGEIVDVLVENGEPVEYGQPLFLVKTR